MKKESQKAKFTASKLNLGDDDVFERDSEQPVLPETCEIEDPRQNHIVPSAQVQSFHPKVTSDTAHFPQKLKKLKSNIVGDLPTEHSDSKTLNDHTTISSDKG